MTKAQNRNHAKSATAEYFATLCRQERSVFPFLPRSVFAEAETCGELLGEWVEETLAGGLHYHARMDRVTTIHEIVVAPEYRGRGIGRRLVERLRGICVQRGQHTIRAKCPEDLPANGFYARLGFRCVRTEPGRKRALNVWELSVVAGSKQMSLPLEVE